MTYERLKIFIYPRQLCFPHRWCSPREAFQIAFRFTLRIAFNAFHEWKVSFFELFGRDMFFRKMSFVVFALLVNCYFHGYSLDNLDFELTAIFVDINLYTVTFGFSRRYWIQFIVSFPLHIAVIDFLYIERKYY